MHKCHSVWKEGPSEGVYEIAVLLGQRGQVTVARSVPRGPVLAPKRNSRDRARLWEAATLWMPSVWLSWPRPPRFSELIKGNGTGPGGRASLQQLTVTLTYASLY